MEMNRYTFNPPEEELISYYLNNKITGKNNESEAEIQINEVNVCHYEPMDLPKLAKIESSNTWYFISPVETFGKLNRRKRASRRGHWKITGNSRTVKDSDGNPIGLKKFLVFQETKKSSSTTSSHQNKSTWIIHEFHSFLHHPNKDNFVLCKVMRKVKRTSATVNVSKPVRELPPTPSSFDSTLSHSQNEKTVEDYGGDYCNELEDFLPEFCNSNWLDQSHHFEFDHFHGPSFVDTMQARNDIGI